MHTTPLSRAEEILQSKIDGTTYNKPPLSRVEELLIELDTGGGGGGGTNDYNQLINKPLINGHELVGDLTAEDLGLAEKPDNDYDPSDEEVVINWTRTTTYDPDTEGIVIHS